ncbi:rubredoxin [Methanosarcina mazei]|uniref:Rubredoxin n=5 Tax=Methanosarcina mazei TaxID=2209 RepID=M1PDL1_METMZ|nr:rubredoxin [Methanosarcina mazei]AGF98647.1 Rubredoxin [Methanosarcina mazei Tuc01]AKB40353.1 Rubredoxin [Methanosarcina mazei WWM610]AKB64586.1 Rubredoxin [Methanosarcina mazei S-6]AKB68407.1 Rubredoxin [Methanosarcina mazei LYC]AKB72641.1 Rubredoxin [Methanosarcina mazei C16]
MIRAYRCSNCGYLYNPDLGDSSQSIAPDTGFEELPKSWKCPRCGVSREMFEKM